MFAMLEITGSDSSRSHQFPLIFADLFPYLCKLCKWSASASGGGFPSSETLLPLSCSSSLRGSGAALHRRAESGRPCRTSASPGSNRPPAREDEPMRLDAAAYLTGVPELVAAELVRNVVAAKEFSEFCTFDRVTVFNGDKQCRIPRRPHALIEVWDARTLRGEARLCVVFQDPGMPPSDEVVMKYLFARHNPELLWQVGVRFGATARKFDGAPSRRW
jgi:hypothetical protein